jgi:hypothetical protein
VVKLSGALIVTVQPLKLLRIAFVLVSLGTMPSDQSAGVYQSAVASFQVAVTSGTISSLSGTLWCRFRTDLRRNGPTSLRADDP